VEGGGGAKSSSLVGFKMWEREGGRADLFFIHPIKKNHKNVNNRERKERKKRASTIVPSCQEEGGGRGKTGSPSLLSAEGRKKGRNDNKRRINDREIWCWPTDEEDRCASCGNKKEKKEGTVKAILLFREKSVEGNNASWVMMPAARARIGPQRTASSTTFCWYKAKKGGGDNYKARRSERCKALTKLGIRRKRETRERRRDGFAGSGKAEGKEQKKSASSRN